MVISNPNKNAWNTYNIIIKSLPLTVIVLTLESLRVKPFILVENLRRLQIQVYYRLITLAIIKLELDSTVDEIAGPCICVHYLWEIQD